MRGVGAEHREAALPIGARRDQRRRVGLTRAEEQRALSLRLAARACDGELRLVRGDGEVAAWLRADLEAPRLRAPRHVFEHEALRAIRLGRLIDLRASG